MTKPEAKTSTIARRALAIVTLIIPFLVVLASWEQWRAQLPTEIASHWSGLGTADASLPTRIVYMGALLSTGFGAMGGVLVTVLGNLSARTRIVSVSVFGLIAGIGMTSWLIPAYLTLEAGVPADAVLGWWIVPQILLPAYGFIPALFLPRPVRKPRSVPTRPLSEEPSPISLTGEQARSYSAVMFAPIFAWLMAGLFVLGVLLYGTGVLDGSAADNPIGWVALAFGGFLCAAFCVIRVSVDGRGPRVVSGLFGIPLKRIRLDQMDVAEGADLRAMEWGGWGYRITPGRSTIILRSGPGLIVTTTKGREFALTLTDPEVPAGLLNALRSDLR